MNESTKKNTTQLIMLVVLIAVLGLAFVRMFTALQNTKPKKSQQAKRPAAAAADTTASSSTPSATKMPPVPRSGDQASKGVEITEGDLHLNPNQFRVYDLNPPKNPFVQEEEWYAEKLKQVPGYPKLENDDYFEQTEAFLPDLPLINQEEWEEITVDRSVKVDPYEITGVSEDGTISTRVQLTPRTAEPDQLNWSRASGVPVNALKSPAWKDRYGDLLSGTTIAAAKKDDSLLKDVLGVPGDGSAGDRAASDLLDGASGAGNGDALYAVGVSLHGKQASALIRHNGKTRIVREGSVIPTHYQVLTIKENGVVVIDLRDGSSNWLPLSAAPASDRKNTKKNKKVTSA